MVAVLQGRTLVGIVPHAVKQIAKSHSVSTISHIVLLNRLFRNRGRPSGQANIIPLCSGKNDRFDPDPGEWIQSLNI